MCAGLSLINAVPLFLPAAYAGLPAEAVAPAAVLLALVSTGVVAVPLLAALAVRRRRRWPRIVVSVYAVLVTVSALSGPVTNLLLVGVAVAALAAAILLWMPASRGFTVAAATERAERGKERRGVWRPVPAAAVPASAAWASGLVTLAGGLWTIPVGLVALAAGSENGLSAGEWQTVLLTGAFAAAHVAVAFACWRGQPWAWGGIPVLLVVAAVVSIRVTPVALFDVALLLLAGILLLTRDARAFLGAATTRRASTRS
ncbi:hypothetical protein [Agromyces soli]|uniref:hypothetical protein n=1 Tax=Agromyces soli TaxID=659012 RepID=UPI0031D4FE13